MKIKFGTDIKKELSGADLYVRIFQLSSLLPMLYIFIASGYTMLKEKTVFSALFDFGIAALPRWEAVLLSLLYRISGSEVAVYFAALICALIFGIAANKLLRGSQRAALITRYTFILLIVFDLILRLIPAHFNALFPLWAAVAGAAVRVICLILILIDIKKAQRSTSR